MVRAVSSISAGFASVALGAIAAVGVLYFFPPQLTITVQAPSGAAETLTSYDLVKLIALSLLVGTAGSSFLSAMQQRALANLNAQNVQTAAMQQIQKVGKKRPPRRKPRCSARWRST